MTKASKSTKTSTPVESVVEVVTPVVVTKEPKVSKKSCLNPKYPNKTFPCQQWKSLDNLGSCYQLKIHLLNLSN